MALPWPFSVLDGTFATILANQRTIIINQNEEKKLMSALSDAVTKISTDLDTLSANLDSDSTAIQAAIAALQQANPDVAAAVTALEALDARVQGYATTIDTNTTALKAAVPPTP